MGRRDEYGEPVVTLSRVCDANEVLVVKAENQRRADRAAEAKQRTRRGGGA